MRMVIQDYRKGTNVVKRLKRGILGYNRMPNGAQGPEQGQSHTESTYYNLTSIRQKKMEVIGDRRKVGILYNNNEQSEQSNLLTAPNKTCFVQATVGFSYKLLTRGMRQEANGFM